MIPTPSAIAIAENTASAPLDSPDTKSPDIVSLIEFVIATPGTKHIIEPIITLSIFSPTPIWTKIWESKAARAEPIKLSIKKVSSSFDIRFTIVKAIKLTIADPIKSRTEPPNRTQKNAAAKEPKIVLVNLVYLFTLFILFNSSSQISRGCWELTKARENSFTIADRKSVV